MCIECGMSVGIGILHLSSCSHADLDKNEEVMSTPGGEGVAVLNEMIMERVTLSVHSLARDQIINPVSNSLMSRLMGKETLLKLAEEEADKMVKSTSVQAVMPMAISHTLAFLVERDMIDLQKFTDLVETLGWTAPDVIK